MTNESGKNSSYTDESLCAQAAAGDRTAEETLVHRHTRLVRMCARPFFLAGGDSEDLIQEGMIGLLTAIREYDPSRGARFRTFAATCVRRRLISVVRAAAGGKHTPLNESVSLDPSLVLAHQDLQGFGTASLQGNPEDAVIHAEDLSALEEAIRTGLTGLEAQVLTLYLEGLSYREIAEEVRSVHQGSGQRCAARSAQSGTVPIPRRTQQKLIAYIWPSEGSWATKSKRGLQHVRRQDFSMQRMRQ